MRVSLFLCMRYLRDIYTICINSKRPREI